MVLRYFKQPIFGVIVLAVILRLFLILWVPIEYNHSAGNYRFDNATAEALIHQGNFGRERYIAPGFPVVLAGAKLLVGDPWAVRFLQLVLSVGLIILSYFLAVALSSKRAGVITALILTFWPPLLLQLFSLLSDLLSAVIMTAILLAGLSFYKQSNLVSATILGLLMACLALTDPAGLFLPVIFLVIVWVYLSPHQSWQRVKSKIGPAVLMIAIFIGAISPWVYRNVQVFGSFQDAPIIQKQFERDFFTESEAFQNSYKAFAPKNWRGLINGTGQFLFIPYQLDALDRNTAVSYKRLPFEVLAGRSGLSFKTALILLVKIIAGLLNLILLVLIGVSLWQGRKDFFSWLFVGLVAFIWLGVVIYSGGEIGVVSPMNGFFFFFLGGSSALAGMAVDNFLRQGRGSV